MDHLVTHSHTSSMTDSCDPVSILSSPRAEELTHDLESLNQSLVKAVDDLRKAGTVALYRLRQEYAQIVMKPRFMNAGAYRPVYDTDPLEPLPIPATLPDNFDPHHLPRRGPPHPDFPATRGEVTALTRERLNRLMVAYGLSPSGKFTEDRATFATFIGCTW